MSSWFAIISSLDTWLIVLWAWFILSGALLAAIDLRMHRLPNRLVAGSFAGAVLLTVLRALVDQEPALLGRALLTAGTLVAFYLALHLTGGMGMGDVKYAAVVGLVLGSISWSALWWGTVSAFLLAGVWVVGRQARSGMDRQQRLAFGPAMVLGAALGGGASLWAS